MAAKSSRVLRCRALRGCQSDAYPLYVFFLSPAELLAVELPVRSSCPCPQAAARIAMRMARIGRS